MSQEVAQRFVILEHDWPFLHWDLMLEDSGRLLTWRILSEPELNELLPASASQDHRLAYLDYVGPVSDDRGTVYKWDSGTIKSLVSTCNRLEACVNSDRFGGEVSIYIDDGNLIFKRSI